MQRIVRTVDQAVHELKNLDNLNIDGPFSTSAYTSALLNGTLQGTGGQNRIGRSFKMDRLQFRFQSNLNQGQVSAFFRIIIVYDRECRGVQAGLSDVLQDVTFGARTLTSPYDFDNVPTRFSILYDHRYHLGSTVTSNSTNTAWGGGAKSIELDIPINKMVHCYNTTAGDITDIDTGSLVVYLMSDSGSNATNYTFGTRLTFRDRS